jgi:DNA topoisomerase VI subunit A
MQHDTANLAIPDVKWLGMQHADLSKVSSSCLQPLTKHDITKAKQLLVRPSVISRPKWKQELEKMLETGMKAEIQALAEISLSYFTTDYLPNKLEMDLDDF